MKIVILDGYTVNPGDLSWGPIQALGDVKIYDRSTPLQIVERCTGAEVIIVNKFRISGADMDAVPSLKAICLLATGYDNVDVTAAEQRSIAVFNAVGYGSESVAQHTLSLMLAMTNRVESHHQSVVNGDWSGQPDFSYSLVTVRELKGQTLGIIGLGKIGMRVAELALAFGMNVIAPDRPSLEDGQIEGVPLNILFQRSDFISLHAPLDSATAKIINAKTIAIMKPNAVIVNTGRGGLIDEVDLRSAIESKRIGGAALDVLTLEPPNAENPLVLLDSVLITPHMAWRSKEARKSLIKIVAQNIRNYTVGKRANRVC